MIARVGGLWVLCLCAAIPATAQPRDARAVVATGSGAIAGTVVTADEPARPVRRAVVTLNAPDPLVGRTAITDDAGRFAFVNLPPARYSISATKRGWASSAYGAKAIGRAGRALPLAAGEHATATIRIARGAVISGTILDQFGQPVGGVTLRVLKYGYVANTGDRRLVPVPSSTTAVDERGTYRIFGLAPGEYYVTVSNPSVAFTGGRDLHLTSDVDVEEALKAAQQGPSVPAADVPQRNVGFSQVFYPGTTSVAQATPISVRAGEERTGVDFTVSYTPTARVEGTVVTSGGTPAAARVTLVANDPSSSAGVSIEGIRNASAGPDGKFTIAEVAPGQYVLSAHATLPPAEPGGRPQILSTTPTDLDVQPEGVSGMSLMLQEGLTVSGIVTYEGAAPGPNLASLRVSLQPVQNTSGVTISTGSPTTAADGRFTLTGVSPGRYRLFVSQPAPQVPWRVRSATLLGQEALDLGVDLRQSATDAAIVLSDQIAELSGKVTAAGGSADYTMILFSTDRAHWRPMSRRVTIARVASDGSYSFRNVPPGDYQIAAVEDVEPGEWYDPSFLQRLEPAAVRVTIAEGEKKVQDVRVGG